MSGQPSFGALRLAADLPQWAVLLSGESCGSRPFSLRQCWKFVDSFSTTVIYHTDPQNPAVYDHWMQPLAAAGRLQAIGCASWTLVRPLA